MKMNKYQQALDYIESILLDEDVLRIFDSPNYPPLIKHHIKKIQELVNLRTPKKLIDCHHCPTCGANVSDELSLGKYYCANCGQRLGDKDE